MNTHTHCYLSTLAAYVAFGILHEFFHLACAYFCGLVDEIFDPNWWEKVLFGIIFRRRLCFDVDIIRMRLEADGMMSLESKSALIRHVGWSSSVLLAVFIHIFFCRYLQRNEPPPPSSQCWSWCILAGYLTALDAVCTDLLRLTQINPLYGKYNEVKDPFHLVFYCGNFGIILLHGAWLDKNGGKSALDILEKMVEVTMMRGAQSGGVVTFQSKKDSNASRNDCAHELIGVRTRVVKSKRGDLCKLLRAKLEKELIYPTRYRVPCLSKESRQSLSLSTHAENVRQGVDPYRVRFFAGHTRFATSSKATLDGTHPHRWSAPTYKFVYDMDEPLLENVNDVVSGDFSDLSSSLWQRRRNRGRGIAHPRATRVENYITHNGDFESYTLNGKIYGMEIIQKWLEFATETKMSTSVDSASIAAMVDIIRCKGCFPLSVRYVICLGLKTSFIDDDPSKIKLPNRNQYNAIGKIFQYTLLDFQNQYPVPLDDICIDASHRQTLATMAATKLNELRNRPLFDVLTSFVPTGEQGGSRFHFALCVIDAFFDNDLFNTVKLFMTGASGSFGLSVTSSLDSHRQVCLAARGQTLSLAFYPQKRIILFGSEQAAVKAGMGTPFPHSSYSSDLLERSHLDVDNDVLRLDLDDLEGEICMLDWGRTQYKTPALSPVNRGIRPQCAMNGKIDIFLFQESEKFRQSELLYHRMTKLTRNPLITALKEEPDDPILQDIRDIPMVCKAIQDDWLNKENGSLFSLNRLTAWNLGRCLRKRLDEKVLRREGTCSSRVDILLTGCEVSLWIAEQFASDLQKAFPKLRVLAISSNKLLGLFGQEGINVPAVGFPATERTLKCNDAITIIVSHSGGTFAPLACANLFQGKTNNIFVVTSEWDTQIGKQLRSFDDDEGISFGLLFNSRIFTTGVGLRPSEPCSVSAVATHQLLTNILEFMSIIILSSKKYRDITGAVISVRDLEILERCNRDNIFALQDIVGSDILGNSFVSDKEKELRVAGDIWSEHILENAKAYVMSFVFIVATVVSGHLLISSVVQSIGLSVESRGVSYFLRFLDALVYFFLPQINILLLRITQKRPLRHRMVARTVVIGDIPWVAQAAEAFLSKIFACSYSIAGINVHSANPSDHLVHKMTHRVVRGTLLICGRPDGRLSALTAMENSVSLSINQASSIQSIGSTCESVTIGHNEFKLPLSARAIFLERYRPLFLCEHLLSERNGQNNVMDLSRRNHPVVHSARRSNKGEHTTFLDETLSKSKIIPNKSLLRQGSQPGKRVKQQSSAALLGIYKNLERDTIDKLDIDLAPEPLSLQSILNAAIHEKKWSDNARHLFEALDLNHDARLSLDEFVDGLMSLQSGRSRNELIGIFEEFDKENMRSISFDQFHCIMTMNRIEVNAILKPSIRDSQGLIQVKPSNEKFFGEGLIEKTSNRQQTISFGVGATKSQNFAQELYESRIASLQRFVAMTVMFHQMGDRVESFFSKNSFDLLGYRKERTHSIMRIATTASPISGADVRERKRAISFMRKIHHSVQVISNAWIAYKTRSMEH